MIIKGDCIEEMRKLPDNSIDAVITDPPYDLVSITKRWSSSKSRNTPAMETKEGSVWARKAGGFMGKQWDGTGIAFKPEIWKECLRVLKPGGFLLSFGATRTYHRIACAIEDAGFEIRDTIMWLYASGFPKSLNIHKQIQKVYKGGNTSIEPNDKQETEHNLRPLSEADISETINSQDKPREILQSELSEQGLHKTMQGEESKKGSQRSKESSMEGRSDLLQDKGKLQRCEICKMSKEISCYVPKGWLCDGTQIDNGKEIKEGSKEDRSDTPQRPQSREQQDRESYAICEQCRTQILREWEGWGTGLKPAVEPIVVARKPLSEKNVALNVLKWGTGGINIDECRIKYLNDNDRSGWHKTGADGSKGFQGEDTFKIRPISAEEIQQRTSQGRFPANIILDKEAGKMFPDDTEEYDTKQKTLFGEILNNENKSASRFFYCAKTSKSERNYGCEEIKSKERIRQGLAGEKNNTFSKNNHPTVKPIKLMEYLIKLVTKEGATVLDPFLGSGTTAIACIKLNRNIIGIEKEEEYIKIINARIKPYLEQTKI